MREPERYEPADDLGHRRVIPLCTTTADSLGCNHPTAWHTGADSPARDCPCCTWRKADAYGVPAEATFRVPVPPGWDPAKWAAMPRRERRAATRGKRG